MGRIARPVRRRRGVFDVSAGVSLAPDAEEGVYVEAGPGHWQCLYVYEGGDYGLEDVVEYFGLGELQTQEGGVHLRLTRRQIRELRVAADAYSFDYDPEFIEMCLAMERMAARLPHDNLRFFANF